MVFVPYIFDEEAFVFRWISKLFSVFVELIGVVAFPDILQGLKGEV